MKLINCINLDDSTNAQAIYASQVYGTFFAIYAKIDAKSHDSDNYDYKLNSVKLIMMNYKGHFDLGITKAILLPEFGKDKKQVGAKLKIEVQALHGLGDNSFEVDIHNDFIGLNKKDFIETERYLRPIHMDLDTEPSIENRDTPIKNGIFDDEFYYREGEILPGEPNVRNEEFTARTWDNPYNVSFGNKSGRLCPHSTSQVI